MVQRNETVLCLQITLNWWQLDNMVEMVFTANLANGIGNLSIPTVTALLCG